MVISQSSALDLYLADNEAPSYSVFSGAFNMDDLKKLRDVSRFFAAVVDKTNREVIKLFRSQIIGDKYNSELITEKLKEIVKNYRPPKYDIIFDYGTIKTFIDSTLPPYNWNEVPVEDFLKMDFTYSTR